MPALRSSALQLIGLFFIGAGLWVRFFAPAHLDLATYAAGGFFGLGIGTMFGWISLAKKILRDGVERSVD